MARASVCSLRDAVGALQVSNLDRDVGRESKREREKKSSRTLMSYLMALRVIIRFQRPVASSFDTPIGPIGSDFVTRYDELSERRNYREYVRRKS